MGYELLQYPGSVYSDAMEEFPEAKADIDELFVAFRKEGPSPAGNQVKTLGKKHAGLWQINLKVQKRQIRVLYAPYGTRIVIFLVHKKSSPQEQQAAYALAANRKREYEARSRGNKHDRRRNTH